MFTRAGETDPYEMANGVGHRQVKDDRSGGILMFHREAKNGPMKAATSSTYAVREQSPG
jgi:hypothetical protein